MVTEQRTRGAGSVNPIDDPPTVPDMALRPASAPDHPRTALKIGLGHTPEGLEAVWDLSQGHLLVTGRKDTGRTFAITGVALEAARRGFEVLLGDQHEGLEFGWLRDWPNITAVETSGPAQAAMINYAHARLIRRKTDPPKAPMVLAIDDLPQLKEQLMDSGQAGIQSLFALNEICQLGTRAGVHLVVGSQPEATAVRSSMLNDFSSRLSLGLVSSSTAQLLWGENWRSGMGARSLFRGWGSVSSSHDRQLPAAVQAYWLPRPPFASLTERDLLEAFRPATETHPALHFSSPARSEGDQQ